MKIKPKDQTKTLAKARWEFSQRNEKVREERQHILELTAKLQDVPGFPIITEADLKEGVQRPAAEGYVFHVDDRERDSSTSERYRKDDAFATYLNLRTYITHSDPINTLLVSIDLKRTKTAIMAEVEELVNFHKKRVLRDEPRGREKWLPLVDELLEVWDLWSEAGKTPAIQTFTLIAKKLKRPVSTVKDQWYSAYEKIYGEKYNSSFKLATEEKRADADMMCAKCGKIAQCYRERNGMMDFIPCKAYFRAIGIEIEREDYSEENEPLTPEDILLDKEEDEE